MGGIHVSHMRDEAAGVLDSVRETIAIGERGGLPTQVTHHKIIGSPNWGRSVDTLRCVDEARARGVDVTIDQYPYTASTTVASSALVPPWALEGGRADNREAAAGSGPAREDQGDDRREHQDRPRRRRPEERQRLVVRVGSILAGKNLAEITRQRGLEPTVENAAETAMYIVEKGGAQGIFHAIDEEDLERIIACPLTMIASDGEVPIFGQASPHPRSYGTFARVLAVYVRDKGLLTLEEAVRKMTSLPARRLGLHDRGILRPGMKADVVVFDPAPSATGHVREAAPVRGGVQR